MDERPGRGALRFEQKKLIEVRRCPARASPAGLRATTTSADNERVAADDLPDLEALATELVQLSRRQQDLLRLHDNLTEQLMAFPNDFRRGRAAMIGAEIQALSERIEWIEAQLLPYRHDP